MASSCVSYTHKQKRVVSIIHKTSIHGPCMFTGKYCHTLTRGTETYKLQTLEGALNKAGRRQEVLRPRGAAERALGDFRWHPGQTAPRVDAKACGEGRQGWRKQNQSGDEAQRYYLLRGQWSVCWGKGVIANKRLNGQESKPRPWGPDNTAPD